MNLDGVDSDVLYLPLGEALNRQENVQIDTVGTDLGNISRMMIEIRHIPPAIQSLWSPDSGG